MILEEGGFLGLPSMGDFPQGSSESTNHLAGNPPLKKSISRRTFKLLRLATALAASQANECY
jgi:hypothetical protein